MRQRRLIDRMNDAFGDAFDAMFNYVPLILGVLACLTAFLLSAGIVVALVNR